MRWDNNGQELQITELQSPQIEMLTILVFNFCYCVALSSLEVFFSLINLFNLHDTSSFFLYVWIFSFDI